MHLSQLKTRAIPFDLNPKWARTLPLGIFDGIFIEPLPLSISMFSNIKVDI
jgi:hypothetical protein